jgi:hypothetical protein
MALAGIVPTIKVMEPILHRGMAVVLLGLAILASFAFALGLEAMAAHRIVNTGTTLMAP